MVLDYKSTISLYVSQEHSHSVTQFCHLESGKITASKVCSKD